MTNEQEEPGYGIYEDKDKLWESDRHHWVHGPDGWSFRTGRNDRDAGDWQTWEAAQQWGPFTRIDDDVAKTAEAAEAAEVGEARRLIALDRAIAFHSTTDRVTCLSDVLGAARKIEAYLRDERS